MTLMRAMMTLMYSGRCRPQVGVEVGVPKEGFLEQARLSLEELHSFIQQIFIGHLLCARLFSRC